MAEESNSLEYVEEEAGAKVEFMVATGQHPPAMIVTGPPGTGKTHIWKSVAEKYGIECDIRQTPMYLPEEIKGYGLPIQEGDEWITRTTRPLDFIPRKTGKPRILVLDDFNTGTKAQQAFLYRLIHEHQIGGHKLQDPTLIALTGNGVADKAIATTLASTVISRAQYIKNVRPQISHWSTWAVKQGIHEGIVAFFRENPMRLYEGPKDDDSWCCPRSIEIMNRDLGWRLSRGQPWDDVMTPPRMASYIGSATANELAQYGRYEKVFKMVRQIVEGKLKPEDKTVVNLEDDAKFVLVLGVGSRAEVPKAYDWLINFGKTKGSKEVAYYGTRMCGRARDTNGDVLKKFSDDLIEVFGDEFRIEMGIKG